MQAGLYNEIAMNLAGGEWRHAGLVALAKQLAKPAKLAKKLSPLEPGQVQSTANPGRAPSFRPAMLGKKLSPLVSPSFFSAFSSSFPPLSTLFSIFCSILPLFSL